MEKRDEPDLVQRRAPPDILLRLKTSLALDKNHCVLTGHRRGLRLLLGKELLEVRVDGLRDLKLGGLSIVGNDDGAVKRVSTSQIEMVCERRIDEESH